MSAWTVGRDGQDIVSDQCHFVMVRCQLQSGLFVFSQSVRLVINELVVWSVELSAASENLSPVNSVVIALYCIVLYCIVLSCIVLYFLGSNRFNGPNNRNDQGK